MSKRARFVYRRSEQGGGSLPPQKPTAKAPTALHVRVARIAEAYATHADLLEELIAVYKETADAAYEQAAKLCEGHSAFHIAKSIRELKVGGVA